MGGLDFDILIKISSVLASTKQKTSDYSQLVFNIDVVVAAAIKRATIDGGLDVHDG